MVRKKSKAAAPPKGGDEDEEDSSEMEEVADDVSSGDASSSDDAEEQQDSDASSEDDGEENAGDSDISDEEEGEQSSPRPPNSGVNSNTNSEEQWTFDLANLASFNTHQVNAAELYRPHRGGKAASKNKSNSNNKEEGFSREWYQSAPCTISAKSSKA